MQSILIEFISESNYIKMLQSKGLLSMILEITKIVLHFRSIDQIITFTLVCETSNIFSTLIEKLSEEYPYLRDKDIFFIYNGYKINTAKTIKQNNILDGSIIMVNFFYE